MNRKGARIGDWVKDHNNNDYPVQVGFTELKCIDIFSPIEIEPRMLIKNGFKVESVNGEDFYLIQKKDEESFLVVSMSKVGDRWSLAIHHGDFAFSGFVTSVGELQHILDDCHVKMNILL